MLSIPMSFMTKLPKKSALSFLSLLSLTCVLFILPVFSADGQANARSYRVEVLIFTQRDNAVPSNEIWPKDVELSYPEKIIYTEKTAEFITIDPNMPSVSSTANSSLFSNAAKRLTKNGSRRVLFHQSWVQTPKKRDESSSIVVLGGNKYGNHFELEGSIKISRERYLHVQTQLWFSQFGGGLESNTQSSATSNEFHMSDSEINSDQWPALPTIPVEAFVAPAAGGVSLPQRALPKSNGQYQTTQIVTFNQKRRMKSNENHYIDHPKLGMLIRITPW